MKKNIIISLICSIVITIFKMLFLIPVNTTGGIAGVNELQYKTIFNLNLGCNDFVDGFCTKIFIRGYVIEGIIILLISFSVIFVMLKLHKKEDNK